MKIKLFAGLVLALFGAFSSALSVARAQGTAFTYQGRLNNASGPAAGSYDLAFTLFATNTSGAVLAGPVTNSATSVTNGLFPVRAVAFLQPACERAAQRRCTGLASQFSNRKRGHAPGQHLK
jgi:hypothetical protein